MAARAWKIPLPPVGFSVYHRPNRAPRTRGQAISGVRFARARAGRVRESANSSLSRSTFRAKNGRRYRYATSIASRCRWKPRNAVPDCDTSQLARRGRISSPARRPPPSIDRLVKCPRATVPRHRDTYVLLSPRNAT